MNRSESIPLIRQVEENLDDVFQRRKGLKVILGVSGGPDSMSLLYIFHRLDIDVTVVHCNYQLRGEASDNDQELVEDTASMWGFETVSVRFDPDKSIKNFQNYARNRRYQVFRDLKRELNTDAIVTAHHQDDQLETIIQKIMRGSGLAAWQGMKTWDGELFRPLLGASKADLLEFASEQHVPYRLDSSNEESTYARNFLRNGWFPLLDDLFPGWRDNILKVPDRAVEYERAVDALVRSVMKDRKNLDRNKFLSLDPGVRKSVMLHCMKKLDEPASVSSGALDNLEQLDNLQTGKRLQLTESTHLLRDRDLFVLQERHQYHSPSIQVDRQDLSGGMLEREGVEFMLQAWDGAIDQKLIQLDADAITWPLKIRTWQEGDRINPLGMDGHQSVADLLTNRKISSADKSEVRVVETADGKLCAILFPLYEKSANTTGTIADWAKCTSKTKVVIQIVFVNRG